MTREDLKRDVNIRVLLDTVNITCCSFFFRSIITTCSDPANAINWSFRVKRLSTGSLKVEDDIKQSPARSSTWS